MDVHIVYINSDGVFVYFIHGAKGAEMSRSKTSKPKPGKEYWSKRPMSNAHGSTPGAVTKKITHKKERAAARTIVHKAKKEIE